MSTFPVGSVQRLREIAAEVIAGTTSWIEASVEVGLHVFTILAWLLQPQPAVEGEIPDDHESEKIVSDLRALCDELMLPQPAVAGLGNGVLIKLLAGQIIQFLLTQLQNPEVWAKILEKLNEILRNNNSGGGVQV